MPPCDAILLSICVFSFCLFRTDLFLRRMAVQRRWARGLVNSQSTASSKRYGSLRAARRRAHHIYHPTRVNTPAKHLCCVLSRRPNSSVVFDVSVPRFESRGRDTDRCAILRLLVEQRQESSPGPDHDSPVEIMSTFGYQQVSQEYRSTV
jgi:hypothetical protein